MALPWGFSTSCGTTPWLAPGRSLASGNCASTPTSSRRGSTLQSKVRNSGVDLIIGDVREEDEPIRSSDLALVPIGSGFLSLFFDLTSYGGLSLVVAEIAGDMGSGRAGGGEDSLEETPRVTRSIMIKRPSGSPAATPPESPAGSTPPLSPFFGKVFFADSALNSKTEKLKRCERWT